MLILVNIFYKFSGILSSRSTTNYSLLLVLILIKFDTFGNFAAILRLSNRFLNLTSLFDCFVQEGACNLIERVFNTLRVHSCSLLMWHVPRAAPLLCSRCRHLPILLKILLVPKDEKWKVNRVFRHTLLEKICSPIIQVFKAILISDIINKDASLGAAIECCS